MSTQVDKVIESGWLRGERLADICMLASPLLDDAGPLFHTQRFVMDRVRELGLPDRHPSTRAVIAGSVVDPAFVGAPRAADPAEASRGGASAQAAVGAPG